MKKHVYQFNKYITKQKLLHEIYPLIDEENGLSEMFLKTISYLNIDEDTLTNEKVSIQIFDQKKNIENYLVSFNLNGLDDELNRQNVVRRLESIGIKEKNVDLNELKKLVNLILNNKNIITKLNNMQTYSYEKIDTLLSEYQILVSESVLRNFVDLLNQLSLSNLTDTMCNFNPMKRTKYYNENNDIISKIVMESDNNLFSTLTEFEGEIYESLKFSNDIEAKEYQEKNNIKEDLLEDVVSLIHFHCESTVNDWYNDISIVKYRMGCIYINYGERLFVQNIKNNSSITAEEIEAIIHEFKYRDINNEFIKYVINELYQFKKTLSGKSERKNIEKLFDKEQRELEINEIINRRENSLKEANRIIIDKNYGDNKTVFVKIKVVSDTPITFKKNNTLILK